MKRSKKSKKLTFFGVELKEDKIFADYYTSKYVTVRPFGIGWWVAEIDTGDIFVEAKTNTPNQALRKLGRCLLKMRDKLDKITKGAL